MNAIVKSPFAWLLKREYWEERRSFLWAQVIVAGVILVITILGIIVAEVARMRMNIHFTGAGSSDLSGTLRNGLQGNMPGLVAALDGTLMSFAVLSGIVLAFVMFFYLLGSLYDDRRDRSVLFWKSLPVSDTQTVISKVIAAVIVAPLIAVFVVLAAYICAQIIASVWFLAHGLNPFSLIWPHAQPYALWLRLLAMIPVNALWALPTVGWLLLWSAVVRSKPFLWAVAIPVVAGAINFWIGLIGAPHADNIFFWSNIVGRALLGVIPAGWIETNAFTVGHMGVNFADRSDLGMISYSSMAHAFTTPQMWIGIVVGMALIAAAVWFRRWRDET